MHAYESRRACVTDDGVQPGKVARLCTRTKIDPWLALTSSSCVSDMLGTYSTTHVDGTRDPRLQGYQVSSVLCPRGVTVMDAQKRLDFKSGRPAGCMKIPACSRARAQDAAAATRFKPQPFFGYCCKTGELNTAICSGSSEVVLCSRQQALERCKSKYSVVCSSLNTAVWPAGRRFEGERAC